VAVLSLFQEHLHSMGAVFDPALDADMTDFPSAYDASGKFFIAETGQGELVAMAGLLKGVIKRLHVKSAFRRHGIGSQLIQRLILEHQLENQSPLQAVVDRNNLAARATFFRCGFISIGLTANHSKSNNCEIFELSYKTSC
jgi:ribosomal protein S18 acetylase RimI-like enzyme